MARILVVILGTWGAVASAKPVKELAEFTGARVRALSVALQQTPGGPAALGEFHFRTFYLNVHAKAGFDLEVVKIEAIPELELIWQRDY